MNQQERDAFASRLRRAMEVKGLKNKEVAGIMGVSGEMIRRYTATPCMAVPNFERIRAFAVATNMSPSWLAYGEGDMIPDERARADKIPVYEDLRWPTSEPPARHILTESSATMALELSDDAMRVTFAGTTAAGGKGSIALIDENARPAPGELVAATNGQRSVVRIYSQRSADVADFVLLSNNNLFPPIQHEDGYRIVGKVVEIRSPQ